MAYRQKSYGIHYTKIPHGIWLRSKGGWIYLYPKGMFRGKENEYVVSTSLTGGSNPEDRQNIGFKTRDEAMKYIREFMEKYK